MESLLKIYIFSATCFKNEMPWKDFIFVQICLEKINARKQHFTTVSINVRLVWQKCFIYLETVIRICLYFFFTEIGPLLNSICCPSSGEQFPNQRVRTRHRIRQVITTECFSTPAKRAIIVDRKYTIKHSTSKLAVVCLTSSVKCIIFIQTKQ